MKIGCTSNNALVSGLFLAALLLLASAHSAAAQGKIAFVSNRDGNNEIYVMDDNGTNQQRLTNNSVEDFSPSISRDGSKIVFQSGSASTSFNIYVINIDGSGLTALTSGSGFNVGPSFSPDGSKILFTASRGSAGYQVYVMDANGSNQTSLTSGADNYAGSFNHDGTKIVFSSTRNGSSEIFVMDANGLNQTKLTDNNNDQFVDGEPEFSPDGSKIVFHAIRGGGNLEVFTMMANGDALTQLTDTLAPNQNPSFSPDGSKIIFDSNRDGDIELYVMNANGTNPSRLTTSPGFDWQASWGGRANAAPMISSMPAALAQDSNTPNFLIATVNDAEENENALSVTIDGSSSGSSNGVTVSGIAVSSSGNVTANIAAICGASNASFTLRVTDGGGRFAEATLYVTVTAEAELPTLSLPANITTSLSPNSTDTSKVVNFTVSATDNCDASPTVVASPAPGSSFPVGTTTVNVTATDDSGNVATGSFTVTVHFNFSGFFQPVDNLPTVNLVSAGQSVPVKFSLSGNKGLNIFAHGFPASQQVQCVGGSSTSMVEETVSAGSSTLSYDAVTDRYIYVWKTERSWRGTCRQLLVRLNDGSTHAALFQFR